MRSAMRIPQAGQLRRALVQPAVEAGILPTRLIHRTACGLKQIGITDVFGFGSGVGTTHTIVLNSDPNNNLTATASYTAAQSCPIQDDPETELDSNAR